MTTREADARVAIVARMLSNGRYATLIAPGGGGMSAYEGFALTRWAPDPLGGGGGFTIFLRDLETGAFHRAGVDPSPEALDPRVEVVVAADAPAERRRIVVRNTGERPRIVEVTTCLELALNTPVGDAGHPAFSKLFVQTGYDADRGALIAWRRLRSPDDRPLSAAHLLVGPGALQHETDRARFVGRGMTARHPAAMRSGLPLGGSVGNVLDPVFALRRVVTLQPGEAASWSAWLVAESSRSGIEAMLDRFAADGPEPESAAEVDEAAAVAATGLPPSWLERIRIRQERGPIELIVEAGMRPRGRKSGPGGDAASATGRSNHDGTSEPLRFFNGHGGFSAGGEEYVIRVESDGDSLLLPPLPWTNVIANGEAGCIVSETGAGYVWAGNSRENRITPWSNDPVTDAHGDALYLRDEETGAFRSLTPGPAPAAGSWEVRHGFGYTRFRHESDGIEQELCVFLPRELPVRVSRLRLSNRGPAPRRMSLWSYARLVLGVLPVETLGVIHVRHDPLRDAILAGNPDRGEFSGRVAFSALRAGGMDRAGGGRSTWTADPQEFLGALADVSAPHALLEGGPLSGAAPAAGGGACFAHRLELTLEPGATTDAFLLLGEAPSESAALACLDALASVAAVDACSANAVTEWRRLLGRVRVETPSPELDLVLNGWLSYQNLSCRMRGRSAFYQSGGAFGFRDQLQDASALVHLDPSLTRAQILLHASHQFVEGDVMHWWHPPLSKGIRTRFSDDLLWLPYITLFYAHTTGDHGVWDATAPFLRAAHLDPGEDERFLVPQPAGEAGSVYEHCCRALDRSLTTGAHRLPLMGSGDWNDGMNRVGREGRGESVWLGFFLFEILDDFIPLCESRGDSQRASRYRDYLRELGIALNVTGWDGDWYRRAYYDDGTPLGSAANDECRIDTIAQAWAVMSGAAPAERAAQALDAMERHLVSEAEGIVRLLTPAFDRTPHDPGYIKGYLPGVRENGGQYTHGALWAARALIEIGRRDRGAALLAMLSPVSHGRTPEEIAVYRTEPYVIAADVYGVEPHVGRGGWTWYTGSAGWMYRIALESLLGVQLVGGRVIELRPCIPDAWPGFTVRYTSPAGGIYRIAVARTGGASSGTLDGHPLELRDGAILIPIGAPGEHEVRILLGSDVGPRYVCRLPEPIGSAARAGSGAQPASSNRQAP